MGKNFTIDNNTYASNPGNTSLNPFIWFIHDYRKIILLIFFLLLSVYLVIVEGREFIVLGLIFFVMNIFYWIRKREHFKAGDSNGGVVVSLKPTLVAVTTDLTKGFGNYPVIKIIKCRKLKDVELGDCIPTVALYTASENKMLPYWVNFNPIPLSFATKDKKVIESAMDSYEDDQWNDLNNWIQEINKPYKEGLYRVNKESSDWGNS